MEFIIYLIVVAFIVVAVWLIVRGVQSGKRIEELSDRLQNLELEIIRLKKEKSVPAADPKPSPVSETIFRPPTKEEPAAETLVATLEGLQQQTPPPAASRSEPPPIPPPISSVIKTLIEPTPTFVAAQSSEPKPEPQIKPSTPPPKGSFEMRLGTYWLVRIGIVMLLTGLVFFGNYAYHSFIGKLGPAGKVSLLYLASAMLLGAGAWWQRKAFKESLRNYAQVLFAGGLAAVYFTTYAAHHIPQLRIIESSVLDGALLLAWAGVMVWIADRRKSELFALFAVALAYYTSVITHVGAFTLYSNLVLALIAVIFLVRNRWAGLSFASLVATYAGYAFWRFLQNDGWRWASPDEGLWFGVYFLMSYWAVFTAAVFLSKCEKLTGESRAGFLTLNNGAFFALFLLTMIQVRQGGFWKFSLAYGTVLLGLSGLAKFYLPKEPLAKNSYLTQGLLLVTLGFITKFAGLKLALVLGTESVVLFVLGTQRKSLLLQIGGYIVAALAVGWAFDGLERFDERGIWLGSALGALMIVNSVWASRYKIGKDFILRPVPGYFALLGLAVWFYATYQNTTAEIFPLALAIETVVLTFSIYLLHVREITLLGQCFLFVAQVLWIDRLIESHPTVPWWNPALLIAISLGLSHWWQRQKFLSIDGQLRLAWQGFYGLAIMGVLYFWLQPLVSVPVWLALTSLLAIVITAYGVFTRAWLLALWGQIFLFVSAGQFALQLLHEKPEWYFPLAPVAAFGLLSFATVRWFMVKPDSDPKIRDGLHVFAQVYRWVALVMSVWWVCEYVPARERAWVLMALGFLVFLLAGWRRNREALLFGAAFTMSGLAYLWVHPHDEPMVYLPNLLAILTLLAQQQIARRLPDRFNLEEATHTAVIIIGCGSLWRYLSVWVLMGASGFYLTASWSALALVIFVCGIVLRERIYRWVGLGILAAAVGRVVLFDVWKQERIYQVLTFTALGIVLLVLGFVYNKYQDKIRQWL